MKNLIIRKVDMTTNNKITSLITALLIFSITLPFFLFLVPKKANAQWAVFDVITEAMTATTAGETALTTVEQTIDTGLHIKDFAKDILEQLLMSVARKALQEVTKSTVNWINSGFHGSPLFLENPESFFQDIAKSEVKNLVEIYGYDSLKYPFGREFVLSTINSYKSQLEENSAHTLSRVMTDPAKIRIYLEDFDAGGWNGFLINTQYPQNNYLGFQMKANEELAIRIRGTGESPAEKVKTLLQQGQGFLSPETCADNGGNNEYNKVLANAWNRPSFDQAAFDKAHKNDDKKTYDSARTQEYAKWWAKNHCKNLVKTTPGSVVADQIKINLGSGVRQKELAAAMGNSLSAIFDALLNKFIGDGLSSLSSTTNPASEPDNWSYDGQILGSPSEGGRNSTWDTGPDVPIVVSDFKKTIDTAISGTSLELKLISNESEIEPGILQLLGQIWPKARELDLCIPGPDLGWQNRLTQELQRVSKDLLVEDTSQLTYKELQIAVNFFKDWINNKIVSELPNSMNYLDAVEEVKGLSQQSNEATEARRLKNQALLRLRSIKAGLDTINSQPAPGSEQEKTLISLWQQYEAVKISTSNSITISDRQGELTVAKEKKASLERMIGTCKNERTAKSWGNPGGWQSSFSGASVSGSTINGIPVNSEQAIFCSLPIIGGYSHKSFLNTTGITHPNIPLVNAENVTNGVNIKLSCNAIFNANILEYKGTLPSSTEIIEIYETPPDDTEEENSEEEGSLN